MSEEGFTDHKDEDNLSDAGIVSNSSNYNPSGSDIDEDDDNDDRIDNKSDDSDDNGSRLSMAGFGQNKKAAGLASLGSHGPNAGMGLVGCQNNSALDLDFDLSLTPSLPSSPRKKVGPVSGESSASETGNLVFNYF